MIDWKIQARAKVCQNCQSPFVDKQAYYTILFDRRHSLERLDVCNKCWESQFSQGVNNRKGFLSFWQGVFNPPPPPPVDAIHRETAESLLRKLLELGGNQYEAACFILAVMLERKKVIKVKSQKFENGKRVLYYEYPKNGDLFSIGDPQLQLQQLEQVQREVALLLEQGIPESGASEKDNSIEVISEFPSEQELGAPQNEESQDPSHRKNNDPIQ